MLNEINLAFDKNHLYPIELMMKTVRRGEGRIQDFGILFPSSTYLGLQFREIPVATVKHGKKEGCHSRGHTAPCCNYGAIHALKTMIMPKLLCGY